MGCIYMRTDPNGKSYIGQTSFDEGKRWKEHCNIAYLKTNTGYDYPLSRAIRKYGPENFTCTILEENIDDPVTLKEQEMYWINYYNTFKNGLNATMGGEGNKIVDPCAIKKLWDDGYCVRDISILLNIWPTTVLNNLDVPLEECKKRGPIYKTKNSSKYIGNYKIGRACPVSCFDMNTGELINTFQSYYHAAKFLGVNNPTIISKAANGYLKSAYGYYWQNGYTTNKLPDDFISAHKKRKKVTKEYVVCVERNEMYSDTVYAQKITGINYRSISYACQGIQKTAGGYHWRYATEDDKQNMNLLSHNKRTYNGYNDIPVICIETGIVYSSIKNASNDTGANPVGISKCCRNMQNTSNGLHWKYA